MNDFSKCTNLIGEQILQGFMLARDRESVKRSGFIIEIVCSLEWLFLCSKCEKTIFFIQLSLYFF